MLNGGAPARAIHPLSTRTERSIHWPYEPDFAGMAVALGRTVLPAPLPGAHPHGDAGVVEVDVATRRPAQPRFFCMVTQVRVCAGQARPLTNTAAS